MEFNNNIPIYIQVIDFIKKDIATGVLKPGDKLLSGRELALKYQINPNTANRVYKELEVQEVCFTKRGLGTFVTEDSMKMKSLKEEMASDLLDKFIEGMKDLGFTKDELINLLNSRYEN